MTEEEMVGWHHRHDGRELSKLSLFYIISTILEITLIKNVKSYSFSCFIFN